MIELPFFHLNLRRNPFGELTHDERTQLGLVELQEALEHLKQPRACVQIVGGKGFGKTTHLLVLAGNFPHSSYVHIPEGQRCRIPATGEPLLIDEAQRLTFYQRWTLLQSNRTLILGTHADISRALARARRPVLTLAADRLTDAVRVCKILNARIEFARRGTGRIPSVTQATASGLYARFGSDVRSMEHALYEVFQDLRAIQDV